MEHLSQQQPQRKSLYNRCSHISNLAILKKVSKAVFSQSESNKDAVKVFYHLKRPESSANILTAQEKEDEE